MARESHNSGLKTHRQTDVQSDLLGSLQEPKKLCIVVDPSEFYGKFHSVWGCPL